jgi:hypothetical protein
MPVPVSNFSFLVVLLLIVLQIHAVYTPKQRENLGKSQHLPYIRTTHTHHINMTGENHLSTPIYLYNSLSIPSCADHSGRAVKGMNCLRSLERWDYVFESNSRHGCLYVRLFCVCVVLRLCKNIQKLKERPGPNKGP